MTKEGSRAVFVDRDGTLNEMVYDEEHGILDSARRPEQVRLIPGAAEFLRRVRAAGYAIIVVSNQPGIAKGTLSLRDLEAVNRRLADLLAAEGARWDDIRCCPHYPKKVAGGRDGFVASCSCRKPEPGLLVQAAEESCYG